MKFIRAIFLGVVVYLAIHLSEKDVHFMHLYLTHDFSSSNILMIKSSFMLTFAILLGGATAGYISRFHDGIYHLNNYINHTTTHWHKPFIPGIYIRNII